MADPRPDKSRTSSNPERTRPVGELDRRVQVHRRRAEGASRKPSEARRSRPSATSQKRSKPRSDAQRAALERRRRRAQAKRDGEQERVEAEERSRRQSEGKARAEAEAAERLRVEEEARLAAERERLNDPELKRRASWQTSDSNIYLTAGDDEPVADDWFEEEVPLGVVPVRDVSPARKRRTSAAMRARSLVIILAIFGAMAALALFVWVTRSVEFSVNDAIVTTHYGTTLADYLEGAGISVTPGNLVSVTGEVLEEGKGDAYSATVNGQLIRPDDASEVRLSGGEIVQITDGADITEDYDVEVVEAPPLLEFDGKAGAISYVSQWGSPGTQELLTGKISGAQAAGDYIEPPVNTVVTTVNVEPDEGRRCVALTFDDGPSSYTSDYLTILDQYGAKATFFMRPANIANNPEIAKAVKDAGHQVATKTDTYESLSDMDAETMQATIEGAFEALATDLDVHTTIFRPPFGAFTHEDWLKSGGVASMSVIWNCDSLDWETPGTYSIVSFALEGLGNGSVILLHDGGGNRDQTLYALPILIEELQSQGFELVTIDELLASDEDIPPVAASGDETMPEGSVWPTEILTEEE